MPEQNRDEEQRTSGSVRDGGLEHSPADEPPLAAGQVLQHQQPQRAERQAKHEQKANQPRPEELIQIHERAEHARRQPDEADDERPLLEPGQRREIRDYVSVCIA